MPKKWRREFTKLHKFRPQCISRLKCRFCSIGIGNGQGPDIISESDNRALNLVTAAARIYGLWVHLGSLPVLKDAGGKYANRSIVVDPEGQIRARYDKLHLFDVDLSTGESWRESGGL